LSDRAQLELAIVESVAWFNTTRLHESLGDLPPAERSPNLSWYG
jgi:transposase InsO family protein